MRASRWQWILLPFMVVSIVGAGALFVSASYREFSPVKECTGSPLDLRPVFERASLNADARAALRFEVAALLEAKVMETRYCQAGYMVRSRMWIRHLAFATGVALALVGATFILGQIEIRPTELGAEGAAVKGALRTSSPGVILASLGVGLMIAALAIKAQIDVNDTPAYWTSSLWSAAPETTPRPWPEAKR